MSNNKPLVTVSEDAMVCDVCWCAGAKLPIAILIEIFAWDPGQLSTSESLCMYTRKEEGYLKMYGMLHPIYLAMMVILLHVYSVCISNCQLICLPCKCQDATVTSEDGAMIWCHDLGHDPLL